MNIFLQILAFLIAIFLLITIHEYGHFWVARKVGIKVLRFSIGFGRPLWQWQGKDGINYVIAWLPLGGYVKLLDEREGEVPLEQLPYAFNRQTVWRRFLVVSAGPAMSWLLGLLLFWLVFIIGLQQVKPIVGDVLPHSIAAQAGLPKGAQLLAIDNHPTSTWQKVLIAMIFRLGETGVMQVTAVPTHAKQPQQYTFNLSTWKVGGLNPDPLISLGITPYLPPIIPVIYKVETNQAAAHAGLLPGDQILAIDGQAIKNWQQFMQIVQQHPNKNVHVLIQRDGQHKNIAVQIGAKKISDGKVIGFLGVQAMAPHWPEAMKFTQQYSVLTAWMPAFQEAVLFSKLNFLALGKMIVGHISLRGLGGPITIFTSASLAFKQGVVIYLSFLALLSVTLACINILPIPGLDGGHLLFLLLEVLRGRPFSVAAEVLAWRLGMIFLILLMVQATMNDLLRLFS